MKRFVLFAFLLNTFSQCFAIDYYSQLSGDPAILANWNTLAGGGGTAPPNFTTANSKFIIQNGHTMTTIATWIIGSGTSTLQIQNGGTLIGNHLIQFTGTFQIDPGGKYIHNNTGSVSGTGGNSIWGGTESFSSSSTVEIQNWITNATPLPAITWGNLIINVAGLGGHWNQTGNLTAIQGNLQIIATGGGTNEFRFTNNTNATVNIAGNLIIDGGILNIKSGTTVGRSCVVQVNSSISVNAGTLSTGVADAVQNAELRFKGSFGANGGTTVTSGDNNSYLVANGTSAQTFSCANSLNCNFRVDTGATVNQFSSITNGSGKTFVISGTYNDNGYAKIFNGLVDISGGVLNVTGSMVMGANLCRVGTGDGTYTGVGAGWQTVTGTTGILNLTGNTITFSQNAAAALFVGSAGPGEVYMTNNSAIRFNTGSGGTGGVYLNPSCILSIDENSFIDGTADYFSTAGGTLRIGSTDGITVAGNTTNGNIRVSGMKNYNASGIYEYFGSNPQVTGDGLPATIAGTLRINNSSALSSLGVTLTNSTTINGFLYLDLGKLRTSATSLMSISSIGQIQNYGPSSFVGGPLKVTGHNGFTYPIGINAASAPTGTIYAPLVMNYFGGSVTPTDSYTAEYIRGNPQTAISNTIESPIDHISFVEYWSFFRTDGGSNTPTKQIVLEVNPESICYNLNTLLVARYDGTQWKNEGNSSVIPIGASPPLVWGKVFSNTFTDISGYYTLSTTDAFSDNPLPVQLISFDATKLANTKSSINWELAAFCSVAAKFEIQRADDDKNFSTIAIVNGSETNRFYNYTDNSLKNGINYYRLKMIDEDGKITYSRTVVVMNGVNGLLLTSLIPTIINNTAVLTVASSKQQKLDLIIVDIQGRVVQKQNHSIAAGNTNIELSTDRLAAGVYQLVGVISEGRTNVIRFVKR